MTCALNFEVSHELFKGFLLAPYQIEETSKRRDKVMEIEKAFYVWMKQISIVVGEGNQIVKDGPNAGPLTELEYWRRMLTKFSNVVEFTSSRPFKSYVKCLELSRSKLIEVIALIIFNFCNILTFLNLAMEDYRRKSKHDAN